MTSLATIARLLNMAHLSPPHQPASTPEPSGQLSPCPQISVDSLPLGESASQELDPVAARAALQHSLSAMVAKLDRQGAVRHENQ